MSDIKMSERFGKVPNFDIKEFMEDHRDFAIPNVHTCYQDINKAVNNYDHLVEENTHLKADKAELLEAVNGILNVVSDSRGVSGYHQNDDIEDWWDFDEICNIYELIQKHKE